MKGPLSAVIVAAAVVLIVIAGVNYFEYGQPTIPELLPVEPPPPSQEIKPAPEPLELPSAKEPPIKEIPETIEENIENLMEAIADVCAGGEAREVILAFSETEANERADELIGQIEIPEDIPLEIRGIDIDFQPGNSVLTEIDTVALGLLKAKLKVKSQVSITDGKPTVTVTEINFGYIPLTDSLKDRVADLVRDSTENLLNQLTETGLGCEEEIIIVYQAIDIQDEEATMTVLIKPKV